MCVCVRVCVVVVVYGGRVQSYSDQGGAGLAAASTSFNPWQDLVESQAMPTPDADAAQAPDAARAPVKGGMQNEVGPRPGEKHNEILYCVACEQYMAPDAFHKSMQKWTLPARTCIVCRDAEWDIPLQPPAKDITPPE